MVATGAAAGLAFDGDADRLVAVDERGGLVDGDHILAIAALDLRARGRLRHDTVVATVMANLGFRRAMAAARHPGGGRPRWATAHVLEAMEAGGPRPRRRAVGPPHLRRPGHHRRRAAVRPRPPRRPWPAPAARSPSWPSVVTKLPAGAPQRPGGRPGRPGRRRRLLGRGGGGRGRAGRRPAGCWSARRAPSRWSASWSRPPPRTAAEAYTARLEAALTAALGKSV